jgi:hypothetical protein
MTHFQRLKYSAFLTVAVLIVLALVDLFMPFGMVTLFLERFIFVPLFVVSYLIAPWLSKKVALQPK